jgi:hypothetical protein
MALVKREGLPVRFALSGGLDSRTALAPRPIALDGAAINVQTMVRQEGAHSFMGGESPGHGWFRDETAFLDRLDLLAGRWIVLTSQDGTVRLYHDAVGTRSVYYDAENRAACSQTLLCRGQ